MIALSPINRAAGEMTCTDPLESDVGMTPQEQATPAHDDASRRSICTIAAPARGISRFSRIGVRSEAVVETSALDRFVIRRCFTAKDGSCSSDASGTSSAANEIVRSGETA